MSEIKDELQETAAEPEEGQTAVFAADERMPEQDWTSMSARFWICPEKEWQTFWMKDA